MKKYIHAAPGLALAWSTYVFCLGSNATAQSITAKIEIDSLYCMDTTGELFSDEVVAAGAWVKHTAFGDMNGVITLPPPDISFSGGKFFDHYGGVDGEEWVFKGSKTLWLGDLNDGESVTLLMSFVELDGSYTSEQFARDIGINLFKLAATNGNDIGALTDMVVNSVRYLIGDEPDLLGVFSVRVRNVHGVLVKELDPGKYARISGAHYIEYTLASLLPWTAYPFMSTLMQQGWHIYAFIPKSILVKMFRKVGVNALSDTRQDVRVLLDGNGPQEYFTSVRVSQGMRRGIWNVFVPQTWTLVGSGAF